MRYLALLRGINILGYKRVSMAELRVTLDRLGLANVQTLLQSGNVVFDASSRSAASLEEVIHQAILDQLGVDTAIFVRTRTEWEKALAANPFGALAEAEPAKVHLVCLRREPAVSAVRALQAAIRGPERLKTSGRQAYVHYPDGQGRSKLTPALLERHLGPSTARNWNTARKLADLAEA